MPNVHIKIWRGAEQSLVGSKGTTVPSVHPRRTLEAYYLQTRIVEDVEECPALRVANGIETFVPGPSNPLLRENPCISFGTGDQLLGDAQGLDVPI